MKKLLGIVVLGLLWCGTANAGLNEPGSKKNFKCTEAGQTGYKEAIAYLKKKPKKKCSCLCSLRWSFLDLLLGER